MSNHPILLIVDDDPAMRELLCDYVQFIRPGWQIVTANNGKKGIEMAESIQPDLIVSDFNMPVMNGYEMAVALRKQAVTGNIPVILLTNEDPDRRSLGCSPRSLWCEVLLKPNLISELDGVLKRTLPLQ